MIRQLDKIQREKLLLDVCVGRIMDDLKAEKWQIAEKSCSLFLSSFTVNKQHNIELCISKCIEKKWIYEMKWTL